MFKFIRRICAFSIAVAAILGITISKPLTTIQATDAKPTWKVLWLNYDRFDVTIGGRRYNASMSESDKNVAASMPGRFKAYIERCAGSDVTITVDSIVPENAVTSVTAIGGYYWVAPKDIKADIDKYAPVGKYDSIIVATRMDGITRNWGNGQGTSADANGATYAFVAFLDGDMEWYMTETAENPYPEEVYVHEWLHGLESFYQNLGYAFPGIDEADTAKFGYVRANNIGYNGWHEYYRDVLTGKVYNKATKTYVGMKPEMWRVTPTNNRASEKLPEAKAGIPKDAVKYEGRYYKVYDYGVAWKDAKVYCEKLGGHLVTITSAGEQKFVESHTKSAAKRWYWIGATCEKKPGVWQWLTGEVWSYAHWESTEANNFDNSEFYANMDRSRNFEWNDLPNEGGYYEGDWLKNGGFVCEWDSEPPKLGNGAAKTGNLLTLPGENPGKGWRVYRSEKVGELGAVIADCVNGDSYLDVNAEPGKAYYYTIKAVLNDGVLGAASDAIKIATPSELLTSGVKGNKGFIIMTLDNPMMTVNGVMVEVDPGRGTAPLLQNSRTFVPIRAIVEAMGGTVEWADATRTATIYCGGKRVDMTLGSKTMTIDGKKQEMDVPAQAINGRTVLPVRFVGEAVGSAVEWIASTKQIVIVFTVK